MRRLTTNLSWDVFPTWIPDGKEIAFGSDRLGNFDIRIIELSD
jgi:Tol biopolymer transport system component